MTKKEMKEIEKRENCEDILFADSCNEYLHRLAARRHPWTEFVLELAPDREASDGSRPCAMVLSFAGTCDDCDRLSKAWTNAVHEAMGMSLNDNDRMEQ